MIAESRVRLNYPKHLLHEPLLYRLIHDFNLITNILQANVGPESGWLIVAIRGESEAIAQGLEWLASQGVKVDPLSRTSEET